jgi:hypothetical protein
MAKAVGTVIVKKGMLFDKIYPELSAKADSEKRLGWFVHRNDEEGMLKVYMSGTDEEVDEFMKSSLKMRIALRAVRKFIEIKTERLE